MKHIFLNLKRFDIPSELGGVNALFPVTTWGSQVMKALQAGVKGCRAGFTAYFPESQFLSAAEVQDGSVRLGCQGVYREDVSPGGNFGAFTTSRPAAAMKAMGCGSVIIGHCEERIEKKGILQAAGLSQFSAVNRILREEVLCAAARGMHVLYCVGETEEETGRWQQVLEEQLIVGLSEIGAASVTIAYEPVWSIGPGKQPASREHIQKVATFLKEISGGLPVVYGGGLKADNAAMLASIPQLDGGLVALTRFTGRIGFYPEEFLEIVRIYLEAAKEDTP